MISQQLADSFREAGVSYEGRGFVRNLQPPDLSDTLRREMIAEKDTGTSYRLLPRCGQMLLDYRTLAESCGARFVVLISDCHSVHALAEPEFLRLVEATTAFCRENGIEVYNFLYAKEDFLPDLDSTYYDLYHMTGEGADIQSAAFARLIRALAAGEDVSSWFYEKDWQYRESIRHIINCWIHPKGNSTYRAGCNTGSMVEPVYRFVLRGPDGKETPLRGWDGRPTIQADIPEGMTLRVYARLTEYPDQAPVWFDYPEDYGYAQEHQELYQ